MISLVEFIYSKQAAHGAEAVVVAEVRGVTSLREAVVGEDTQLIGCVFLL